MSEEPEQNFGGEPAMNITEPQLNNLRKGNEIRINRESPNKVKDDIKRWYHPDSFSSEEYTRGMYDPPERNEVAVHFEGGLMTLRIAQKDDIPYGKVLVDKIGTELTKRYREIVVHRQQDSEDPSRYYQIIHAKSTATGRILKWNEEDGEFHEIGEELHDLEILPRAGYRLIGNVGAETFFIDPETGYRVSNTDIYGGKSKSDVHVSGDVIIGDKRRSGIREKGKLVRPGGIEESVVLELAENVPPIEPISLHIDKHQISVKKKK